MALTRINITIPAETIALVDAVAGRRGRSAYIADLVIREAKRERARQILRETAGVLRGNSAWGETPAERDANLREARDSWDRDDRTWSDEGDADAVPA